MGFLRVKEFAQACGVAEITVKRWLRDRVIPFNKIGKVVLIDPERAKAALNKHERKAATTK
jgi:excisionase family DNA binding protein